MHYNLTGSTYSPSVLIIIFVIITINNCNIIQENLPLKFFLHIFPLLITELTTLIRISRCFCCMPNNEYASVQNKKIVHHFKWELIVI